MGGEGGTENILEFCFAQENDEATSLLRRGRELEKDKTEGCKGGSFSPMWVAAFFYESQKSPPRGSKIPLYGSQESPRRGSKIPRIEEAAIPTAQRVKSVTGRRFGGMVHRASPCNDAMRKKLVKAMLIAEGISGIAIIEVKAMFALSN